MEQQWVELNYPHMAPILDGNRLILRIRSLHAHHHPMQPTNRKVMTQIFILNF